MHAAADVPVLQLSIDAGAGPADFMNIGKALQPLRDKGILIVGSGNIVHNLQLTDWSRLNDYNFSYDWAREADSFVKGCITEKKWESLAQFGKFSDAMKKAVNSAEHFIPLLYILGAAHANETPQFFNEIAVGGALTMTSVRFG
jgi:4,5-DOPA dioxygenase extradiol